MALLCPPETLSIFGAVGENAFPVKRVRGGERDSSVIDWLNQDDEDPREVSCHSGSAGP